MTYKQLKDKLKQLEIDHPKLTDESKVCLADSQGVFYATRIEIDEVNDLVIR